MKLPEAVARFLDEYHAGGVTERDCRACSSPCCSLGGFAILENVLQIYELYRCGALSRTDYEFEADLAFGEFVFRYFDVYRKTVSVNGADATLMLFHMRSLTADGQVISIPGGDHYWDIRKELFELNPWLNRGCVFLSRQVDNWPSDDADVSRHCILHVPGSATTVTAKPIDCVFFTCTRPREARVPSVDESAAWFRLLAEYFPNSRERFETLIAEEIHTDSASMAACEKQTT